MKHDRPKPVVGESLIAVTPEGRYRKREEEILTVTKVGRKYFECSKYGQFCMGTWLRAGCNVHVNWPVKLYRTRQEMADEEEHIKLAEVLSGQLRYQCDFQKLSLAQLRAINRIVQTP